MKFICIAILLSVTLSPTFGQQFSFKELVAMSKSQSVFEQNMARKAIFPKSKYENDYVQYRKANDKVFYWDLSKNLKVDSSIVDNTKIVCTGLEYIENYSVDEEYGTAVYYWNETKVFAERGELLLSHQYRNNRQLRIKYQSRTEYLSIINQLNAIAKFIKSEESESFLDEKQLLLIYNYADLEIVVKSPQYSEIGGEIRFIVPTK